jgi:hypothetical protein
MTTQNSDQSKPGVEEDVPASDDGETAESEPEAVDGDIVIDDEVVVADDVPGVELEDEEEEEEEEEEAAVVVAAAPVARPAVRPQPGRPPSAKEEPPPPFAVGERVILIQNTRPRTGTPIGNYPVGATGRVETVLSQTAIVRFDDAPDTKEVVAFTCLESAEKPPEGVRPSPEEAGAGG